MASAAQISRFCVRNERTIRLHLRPRGALASYSTNEKSAAGCCTDSSTDDKISKLDIDRESPLKGTVAGHQRHIVFATGDRPWPSKIDSMARESREDYVVDLLQRTKARFGRSAREPRPDYAALISTSTFDHGQGDNIVYIFPDFKAIESIDEETLEDPRALEHLIEDSIIRRPPQFPTTTLEPASDTTRHSTIDHILVLICGHGSRDSRCGVLGPLLQAEFEQKFERMGFHVCSGPSPDSRSKKTAAVQLVSHIGGHKFAGNVIVYIPPSMNNHKLSGSGVWYGRVEPKHVESIIQETIVGGNIMDEHFRGGMTNEGTPLTAR